MTRLLKRFVAPALLVICFLAIWRCASQTRIPANVRAQIAARHQGRTVELRHSYYYGDLYDDNALWMLSPYAFQDTSHIVDLDGEPLHPKSQRGVVAAGTKFVVERVEFPDATAMAKRMLTTPRYNPWVYLIPVPSDGTTERPALNLENRRAFVAILPMDLDTEDGVETALKDMFAPTGEVTTWLAARKPTHRVAIEHKDVLTGMSRDELIASWGVPPMWFVEPNEGTEARVAWYTSKEVWLVNDEVKEVKQGREVKQPPNKPREPEATKTTAPDASAPAEAAPAPPAPTSP